MALAAGRAAPLTRTMRFSHALHAYIVSHFFVLAALQRTNVLSDDFAASGLAEIWFNPRSGYRLPFPLFFFLVCGFNAFDAILFWHIPSLSLVFYRCSL